MNEIVAIVEGQTEQTFVQRLLSPYLGLRGLGIWARLPGRIRRRGGVPAWESVRGDIIRTLQERRGRICTIMFDFFRMPNHWPGRETACQRTWRERGTVVEQALLEDIRLHAGQDFRDELFIPYVQVHEFEALLFADVSKLAEVVATLGHGLAGGYEREFVAIRDEVDSPEAINDGEQTSPSRRITRFVQGYRKPVHGPIVAERIGLITLRKTCPHFNEWLERLEAVASREEI